VVLVDDDDAVRGVCAEHLRGAGYDVIPLPSGEAALTVISERGTAIDALVTDVSMPGMSGLELARAVRARGSRIPVLLISGYADELERGTGRERLDASFLPKPFSGEGLVAEVERLFLREPREGAAENHLTLS
jgi:DNA-binding response OmpR family regulator